ncbi:MAG: tRNA (adenosine(37)-N6)-threonylcarbamoyltransferase complex dimerization subunit type 1 TsaB [Albidovulum sp.]|nr:tRNA (adenosine(37)-N6)-threonylcarbamoyltransferase complex dimerization subunit type 1 TsaB [Albidovulum sp.]
MPSDELPVLGFDTSSAFCSAAIVRGGQTVSSRSEHIGRGHAERLFPLIESILGESDLDWRDLAAIGTGTGPGNFTGTRISVAAARGLSMSLGIPAVGVSGFDALRFGNSEPVLASIDAGRNQVFLQRPDSSEPRIENPDSLDEFYCDDAPAAVVGHESERIAARLGIRCRAPRFPTAVAIARIAALRMNSAEPPPAPVYIRRFPATQPGAARKS